MNLMEKRVRREGGVRERDWVSTPQGLALIPPRNKIIIKKTLSDQDERHTDRQRAEEGREMISCTCYCRIQQECAKTTSKRLSSIMIECNCIGLYHWCTTTRWRDYCISYRPTNKINNNQMYLCLLSGCSMIFRATDLLCCL